MLNVVNIVGTRPNLVKMAAVLHAQRLHPDCFAPRLVHTGQHHLPAMSRDLLLELDLPMPDITLACGGGGHAVQVGRMLIELERVLGDLEPDLVVVVGDVNSTAAGALAAATLGIPVAHVEAGLRSFDRRMPEEINRVLVDTMSDVLLASEPSGVANLKREGRSEAAIHHVGNVMIDTLVRFHARAAQRDPAAALGVREPYAVLTLHRPTNVDTPAALSAWLHAAGEVTRHVPVIFPMHPRTRDRLSAAGLDGQVAKLSGLHVIAPLGYLDMLGLLMRAALALTDSGGIQEETTYLGVPCLTLRDSTERPATVTDGTNRVIGTQPRHLLPEVERLLRGDRPPPRRPALWDGRAAERVAAVLARHATGQPPRAAVG